LASQAFTSIYSRQALGVKGALQFDPLVEGEPVKLHIRGVVGFCDVLLRMMRSIDAELCRSKHAEDVFCSMLRAAKPNQTTLSTEVTRRNAQIIRRCSTAGLPRPADIDAVYGFMRSKRIVAH